MEPFIQIKNLRKVYKIDTEKVVALNEINLEISRGEICCVLGTSGSGKSTLLNMLAGLERPSRGEILIGKYNIASMSEKQLTKFRQRYVGFVFQSYNLIPSLTSIENVAMPLVFRGTSKKERERESVDILKNVGLSERLKHKPTQMSGGQQQRVGIARAFVAKPKLIFADEPTGNLDSKTTAEVMELMIQMARKHQQTLIIVTHDQDIARYADRIIHIIDGQIDNDMPNQSILPRQNFPVTDQEPKKQADSAPALLNQNGE